VSGTDGDMQWYLSQVKGTIEEDVTEGKWKSVIFVFLRRSLKVAIRDVNF